MFNKIIWITGMPRSGTNWLSQIFASSPDVRLKLCPLFSYEFKNAMDERSAPDEWRRFFEAVYVTRSEYLDQEYVRKDGLVPLFPERRDEPSNLVIKSTRFHNLTESILEKSPETTFVTIVRHPCATIHSWLTNPLELPEGVDPAVEWRTGACRKASPGEFWGFDDWKWVTEMQLRLAERYPDRILLLRYEELVQRAEAVVRELFSNLGMECSDQTLRFLVQSQTSHSDHKRSVFKSPTVADRWKNEMDPAMARTIIAELKGSPLERFTQEVQ